MEKSNRRIKIELAKSRKELHVTNTTLRLLQLREMRRPRLVRGEPSQLLLRDELWSEALEEMHGEDLEGFSSVESSLIGLTTKKFLDDLAECDYELQSKWKDSIADTVNQLGVIVTGMSRMMSELGQLGCELHEDDVIQKVQETACLLTGATMAHLFLVDETGDSTHTTLYTHADGQAKDAMDPKKEWISVPNKRFATVTRDAVTHAEDVDTFESPNSLNRGLSMHSRSSSLTKTAILSKTSMKRRTSFYNRIGVNTPRVSGHKLLLVHPLALSYDFSIKNAFSFYLPVAGWMVCFRNICTDVCLFLHVVLC